MGRKRKDGNPLGLERRVYWHHGQFRYRHATGAWEDLGTDVERANERARALNDPAGYGTVGHWIQQYIATAKDVIAALVEKEIVSRGAQTKQFIGAKGDVLIWHSCLMHRGSEPRSPGMLRPSLIAHYAAVNYAAHFPRAVQHDNGGWYFKFTPPGTNRPLEPLRKLLHRFRAPL